MVNTDLTHSMAKAALRTSRTSKGWCWLVLLGLLWSSAANASISARLNKSQIYTGDTVVLELAISGNASSEPDLSVLEDQFEVLGTGRGSQIQIINGTRSQRQTWSIRLRPRGQGEITVPPLTLGNEKTPALLVNVVELPVAEAGQGTPVFIEMDVKDPSVYVQQQLRLITRLYHRRELLGGDWSEPVVADAMIEQLGPDKTGQVIRDGIIYQFLERQYAVIPERSGAIEIPPTRFRGEMSLSGYSPRSAPDPRQQTIDQFFANDFFDRSPFSRPRGEAVQAIGAGQTITVKPIPTESEAAHWMPAQAVVLKDSWEQTPPDFSTGAPVTRTIEIEAKGLAASQLPTLEWASIQGMGAYPQEALTSTRTDGEWVYARSSQVITYVPQANGEIEIPEIALGWWNTQKNTSDRSVLPKHLAMVNGVAFSAEPNSEVDSESTSAIVSEKNARHLQLDILKPVLMGIGVALLALVGLSYWMGRKVSVSLEYEGAKAPIPTLEQPLQALKKACENNQSKEAKEALLDWAKAFWPEQQITGLESISTLLPQAAEPLRQLDNVVYGSPTLESWDGTALWLSINDAESTKKIKPTPLQNQQLEGLYPHSILF